MKRAGLAAVLFALAAAPVMATALPPATSDFRPGLASGPPFYTLGALPAYINGSNLVGGPMISPYTLDYAGDGTLTSTVYKNPGDNNTLTFVYKWTNTSPDGIPDIVRNTLSDPTNPWLGWIIQDAGSDTSGSSTAGGSPTWTDGSPNFVLRDPTFSGEGLTVQFRTGSVGTVLLGPSDLSASVWFDTNATNFRISGGTINDQDFVGHVQSFAPDQGGIPEPATMSLLGLGLLAMIRRRRSH